MGGRRKENIKSTEMGGGGEGLVVDVVDYKVGEENVSSRRLGFQQLVELDLQAPDPRFIGGHSAFEVWRNNEQQMTEELKEELSRAFKLMQDSYLDVEGNPVRGVYIGRAFWVPGDPNPNGPRTADIRDKNVFMKMVERFWRFAIEHRYDQAVEGFEEDPDVALIVHPFINAGDYRPSYGRKELGEIRLPWSGGYIVCETKPNEGVRVRILANYGPDEVVKEFPSDDYLIDLDDQTIKKKVIRPKFWTLLPKPNSQVYEKTEIDPRFREQQTLTDVEILAIAEATTAAFENNPNTRIEFIMQPEGPVFTEIAPWENWDNLDLLRFKPGEVIESKVVRIEAEEDVEKITEETGIVYFAPEAHRRRTTDLFSMVARRIEEMGWNRARRREDKKIVCLVPGNSVTGHHAKVLADKKISMQLVGDLDFSDGDLVRVKCCDDGTSMVEYVDKYHGAVVDGDDFEMVARLGVGNKMKGVMWLG